MCEQTIAILRILDRQRTHSRLRLRLLVELTAVALNPTSGSFDNIKFVRDGDAKPFEYSCWSDLDSSTVYRKFIFAVCRKVVEGLGATKSLRNVNRNCEGNKDYKLIFKVKDKYKHHGYSMSWGSDEAINAAGIVKSSTNSAAATEARQWMV